MNRKLLLGVFSFLTLSLAGLSFILGQKVAQSGFLEKKALDKQNSQAKESKGSNVSYVENKSDSEENSQLKELTQRLVNEMKAEERLDLGMVSQLRAYRDLLGQSDTYIKQIEKELDVIKEINNSSFQEDIVLQAALFAGKPPALIAKHLEGFNAARVGAILAKMKDKEASTVLDVWASSEDSKANIFYKAVMSAYLVNKRRDVNPDLYQKVTVSQDVKKTTSPT